MFKIDWRSLLPLLLIASVATCGVTGVRADDGAGIADVAEHAGGAEDHHAPVDHAAGDGAHGEHHPDTNRPPIFPDRAMGELFVFSLVFFCLFLVVARKYAWLPMVAGLDSREARVNQALADAEAARVAALKLLDEHQKHLDQVTEQVKEIVAEARGEAEREKARIIAEAEAETTALRDQAIADIYEAQRQSLQGLDERIDVQVATATGKILG
jgi:F-type H+-transporting ATPase subunit b